MKTIELIASYEIRKELFYSEKDKLSRNETELAIINSQSKTSTLTEITSTTRQPASSSKMVDIVDRIKDLNRFILESKELIKIYEPLYFYTRDEIKELFDEYKNDKNSRGKEKNTIYIFYYRDFKRNVMPYDEIAAILGTSSEYLQRLYKDVKIEIKRIKELKKISKDVIEIS